MDLLIRHGTVVTAGDICRSDVGIDAGRVVALGFGLGSATREIDATGKLVLPGGVETHCHLERPDSAGLPTAEDLRALGASTARGGTTTIVLHVVPQRVQPLREALLACRETPGLRAPVDFRLHLMVSDPNPAVICEVLPALAAEGCASLEVELSDEALQLSDRQMLDLLGAARSLGALVMVHAGSHNEITRLAERLPAPGRTVSQSGDAARSAVVEGEATHRAIALAELAGAPVLIGCLRSAEALEEVRRGRDRGVAVYAGTCPQFLAPAADIPEGQGLGGHGQAGVESPGDAVNRETLWRGLVDGSIQVVASGRTPHGTGLDLRLPILFSEGVVKGRLDLNRFVAVTATEPARLFGLYPGKGTIAIGSDGDLAIWDLQKTGPASPRMSRDRTNDTPYEGVALTGWPVATVSRGQVVWIEDGAGRRD